MREEESSRPSSSGIGRAIANVEYSTDMRCRAESVWRQISVAHRLRCRLVDEQGQSRNCPFPLAKERRSAFNAPDELFQRVCDGVRAHPDGKAITRAAMHGVLILALFCAPWIVLHFIVAPSPQLYYIGLTLSFVVGLAVAVAAIRGRQVRSYAAALSDVCGTLRCCAFCFYPIGGIACAVGSQADSRCVCPECGGCWTLPSESEATPPA